MVSLLVLGVVVVAGLWGWFHRQQSDVALPTPPALGVLSVQELANAIVKGQRLLVLDLRPETDFLASHIPNAVSMPTYQILRSAEQLTRFASWQTVLVCQTPDCPAVTQASRDLRLLGFQDLRELSGGFAAYATADLSQASQAKLVQQDLVDVLTAIKVPTLSATDLIAHRDTYAVIDTRTPYEFVTGFIPGAIDLPLYATKAAIDDVRYPKEKKIVVYDRQGNRSRIVAKALLDAGYKDVQSLEGGFEAWKKANGEIGLPKQDGSDLKTLIPLLDQPAN